MKEGVWKQRRRGAAKPLPRPVIPTERKQAEESRLGPGNRRHRAATRVLHSAADQVRGSGRNDGVEDRVVTGRCCAASSGSDENNIPNYANRLGTYNRIDFLSSTQSRDQPMRSRSRESGWLSISSNTVDL